MHVYEALSLYLNWLLGLLGLAERRAPISDHPLMLAIVFGFGWLLLRSADNRERNPDANEFDQEHPNGEIDHDFYGTPESYAACAFCGNLSTARCSRCKVARYCSMECQSRHWRSGHEYECYESETEGDDHQGRPIHDDGISMLVDKPERESTSDGDGVGVDVSSDSDVNNFNGCEVCGSPTTTSCSRCTLVRYCSTKCLIMNWRLHKDNCIAGEVNSAPAERPNANVGVLENSYEEEENINTSPLYLELHPEGTTNFRSPIKASQDPTKETLVHRTVWMRYLQDEVEKSRKEISILKSERDLWKNRANLTREIYQSIKKQSEDQLFVLKTEKESILNAEKQACNVIHSLHERIKLLQIEVQERISEKRRLEEHTQMVESECAKLKKELQEEHKRAQWFTVESNRNHEIAQIAMREAEAVRRELQGEREHVQRLKENFLRDFRFAESRAAVAEAKLSDLHRRVRLTDYKAPVVTDSLGRPAMACTICLTNEKDLAFGCGHMVSSSKQTCRDCGLKLTKCPICREQITSHIRLFPG